MSNAFGRMTKSPAFAPVVSGLISFTAGLIVGNVIWKKSDGKGAHSVPVGTAFQFTVEELNQLRDMAESADGNIEMAVGEHGRLEAHITPRENSGAIEDDDPKITEEQKVAMAQVEENVTITINPVVEEPDEAAVVYERRSVFTTTPDWDMEAEMASRTPGGTYVIHQAEFDGNEFDYEQIQLTWYTDRVMTTSIDEKVVFDWAKWVGDEIPFGRGCEDADVVHIRNESRREEYEITRSDDTFVHAVQGEDLEEEVEAELRHSADSVPRMRPDD